MELIEIEDERRLSREEAAKWLHRLADSLERHNELEFVHRGMRTRVDVPADLDLAGIGERARYIPVYLVLQDGELNQIILPVYGKGLWSTMYGYLSVAPDGNSTRGLQFYAHGETPGLGDQMDKEAWRAQWDSKKLYADGDEPQVRVIKGLVPEGIAGEEHMIDGMSGATLTGNGITGLIQYWTGPHGFGPYLKKYREAS